MKLTKIIFDPSTFRCIPSYEEVDPVLAFETQQHRLGICQDCSEFKVKDVSGNTIQYCGCCGIRLSIIYPEDENGNAFFYVKRDEGTFGYACKLKKW